MKNGQEIPYDFDIFENQSEDALTMKKEKSTTILVPLSFASYLIAVFSFLGSIFFTIFFGIGLAALPLDWINIFRKRPKVMNKAQLVVFRQKFAKRSGELLAQVDAIYAELLKVNFNDDKARMRYCIQTNN